MFSFDSSVIYTGSFSLSSPSGAGSSSMSSAAGGVVVWVRKWKFHEAAQAVRIDQIVLDLFTFFFYIEHGSVQLAKSKF